ncbi:MAG: hypothetical protein JSS11_11150 [Verrucomicrobia bacterium]|nr:hypothetical protein [Verrucomicrobiota bacterium]
MKARRYLGVVSLALAALLTGGCGTTDTLAHRIEQNREVYAGLSAEEKKQINDGVITVGFSPEMVLMALGKPERVVPGRGPGEEDWVYVNVYSRDGNSLAMASKVTSNFNQMSGSSLNPVKFNTVENRNVRATFQLEPDLANEQIKAESAIKVHVKFTEGSVADIQVVTDGKG